jgi:hypothetical protein
MPFLVKPAVSAKGCMLAKFFGMGENQADVDLVPIENCTAAFTFAMMIQNLNSRLLCSSHAMKMVVINYHSSN